MRKLGKWSGIGSMMVMPKVMIPMMMMIGVSGCEYLADPALPKVTNGAASEELPYVVRLTINDRSLCTGTFVSDKLLLTAAHCIENADFIRWGEILSEAENFVMHPNWTHDADGNARAERPSRYDVALVSFPEDSFTAGEPARILARAPIVNEHLTIMGYGNSEIEVFDTYCSLKRDPDANGDCSLTKAAREDDLRYVFQSLFTYKLASTDANATHCSQESLIRAYESAELSLNEAMEKDCGGQLRDKSFAQRGAGTKRIGTNVVQEVRDGVILFSGVLSGEAGKDGDGEESASGSGDSGGPLFVEEDGVLQQAGVTHGGRLVVDSEKKRMLKRSIYVDLNSEEVSPWLKANFDALK